MLDASADVIGSIDGLPADPGDVFCETNPMLFIKPELS
jgi:hypothetical protein